MGRQMADFETLVQIQDLTKIYGVRQKVNKVNKNKKAERGQYGDGDSLEISSKTALDSVNLNIESGRIIGLLGENGCGKTTLLKILAGVLQPSAGSVKIAGAEIGAQTKAITSFLPDADFLDKAITPAKAFHLYQDFFPDFDIEKARELLAFLGLHENQRYQTMSKGMREKLKLILIMSREAKLYLLDEPISGVDPAARQALLDTILRGWNPDSTLIISTHLITDIEAILDQAILMRGGKILMYRNVDELREEYGSSLDQLFRKEYANVR
ncbi:ABC transporter ATP-binding protein [Arcanobacterium hippocoleae]